VGTLTANEQEDGMSTNRQGRPTQLPLRLRAAEQRVRLETTSEQDLIAVIAALLRAAAQTDTERAERGDDHDE
jgi:hypothetical protein